MRKNLKVKEETRSTLQCRNLLNLQNENAAKLGSDKGHQCQWGSEMARSLQTKYKTSSSRLELQV